MTTELPDELAARWDEIGLDGTGERHLVVLPSMTIDIPPPLLAGGAPALLTRELRLICMLPLLLQPGTSLIYLTSATVCPMVADYWFGLVPGLDTGEARRRLTLLSADDPSPRPLAAKLLERPELVSRIRGLIPDPSARTCSPSTPMSLITRSPLVWASRCTGCGRTWRTVSGPRAAPARCSQLAGCPTLPA